MRNSVLRTVGSNLVLESLNRSLWDVVTLLCVRILQVKVTLRLTMSQYIVVSSRLWTRYYYFLSEGSCLVFVGRPLWWEVESVFCQSQPVLICQNVHLIFTLHEFHTVWRCTKYIQGTADVVLLVTLYSSVYIYGLGGLGTFPDSAKYFSSQHPDQLSLKSVKRQGPAADHSTSI
jgi:hypothetical protein